MAHPLHRGPHPDDGRLFAPEAVAILRRAATEIAWLRDRGYGPNTALAAAGNHHQLELRQRAALARGVCAADELARRRRGLRPPSAAAGGHLHVDGFNLIISLEVALGGGVLVEGRDGCLRDLAGLRGSYHLVAETPPALALLVATLGELAAAATTIYLDAKVANSGRLRRALLAAAGGAVDVELVGNADPALAGRELVVSADGPVIERAASWINLGAWIIERRIPQARRVRLFEGLPVA